MDLVKLLWCRMWHTEDLSESLIFAMQHVLVNYACRKFIFNI